MSSAGQPPRGHALAGSLPASRLAMGVATAVFIGIAFVGLLHVLLLLRESMGAVVLSVVCVVALMVMQLVWYVRDAGRLRSPLGYAILCAQAGLVYLPILLFGQAWFAMPGFLAAACCWCCDRSRRGRRSAPSSRALAPCSGRSPRNQLTSCTRRSRR